MSRTLALLLHLTMACVLGGSMMDSVSAQERPVFLQVPHSLTFHREATTTPDSALRLAPLDASLWKTGRRMRMLTAVGTGLLVSAAIHVAWASNARRCYERARPPASLVGASFVAGLGATMVIGGASWLSLVPRNQRYLPTPGQGVGASALALGVGLATQAVLALVWAVQEVGSCSS
jgi:hypothetical protein